MNKQIITASVCLLASLTIAGITGKNFMDVKKPDELRPGDLVRLRFAQGAQGHMPVVVAVGQGGGLGQILVAAHSDDADFRPLSSYPFHQLWGLHILGSYR